MSADSLVRNEIWLPLQNWNGRLLNTGNGAMAGAIRYGGNQDAMPDYSLATGLRRGYAVANSDLGTSPYQVDGYSAVGHVVKWYDFGFRATHETAIVSKQIVARYYGRGQKAAYFAGCSTGGMQGLREAQQFPDDFDGILVGNPGNNRSRLLLANQYQYMLPKLYPADILSPAKLKLMSDAVLKACGTLGGGLASDPFLAAPQQCRWKPETLACTGSSQAGACLTQGEIALANKMYDGPRNNKGEIIFPGLPRGTELGWQEFMEAAPIADPPFLGVNKSVLGQQWDWRKMDWDKDASTFIEIMGFLWDATNTDLTAFEKAGGKLMLYFGLADSTAAADDAFDYYAKVGVRIAQREGLNPAKALAKQQNFFRAFFFPGMGHCRGGLGPNTFDGVDVLAKWVEGKEAPASIVASYTPPRSKSGPGVLAGGASGESMTRPVCAYPKHAVYKGSGDRTRPENFNCR
ncbi:tannase/feruloyl esterase family alpha/beta hydrolase [Sphingobium sp.]|uniref:tannase/feruloyl esterase family alpha/beta hydrolase n=1 Tax=Sphingobium sp. TaxID=1912891 RepID=UPI002CAEABD4|nr:tannase/feruloyl esterase family alpha/beta hydrolase [Sphingobium sp.]HUD92899.1 tannase/feruloyl esterase family alpha/beta hydrolase [Sphingobium sp.]